MTGLVDIGANLTHDSFARDRGEVLERALDAGVTHMIVTGTSTRDSERAADLARLNRGLLSATAGVHPHHASEFNHQTLERLDQLAERPEVVAIGETGLDFFRNYATREAQTRAFEGQIDLARKLQLPVFLHQRDAHDEFMAILAPTRADLAGGVAHCFTGEDRELFDYLDLDLYIGVTGWICDERRGHHLQDLVRRIPIDRILLETDAPYLLPRDLPKKPTGRRNEPAFLAHILEVVAGCLDMTPGELAAASTANATRLFQLKIT